jgi:hypothetical protein
MYISHVQGIHATFIDYVGGDSSNSVWRKTLSNVFKFKFIYIQIYIYIYIYKHICNLIIYVDINEIKQFFCLITNSNVAHVPRY